MVSPALLCPHMWGQHLGDWSNLNQADIGRAWTTRGLFSVGEWLCGWSYGGDITDRSTTLWGIR